MSGTVSGFAVPFRGQDPRLPMVEEYADGPDHAFAEQEREGFAGVTFSAMHNTRDIPLANTAAGTGRVSVAADGLHYSFELPQSRPDVAEALSRGDLRQTSIGFKAHQDTWGMREGRPYRFVKKARLRDVSLVPTLGAAFRETTATLTAPQALLAGDVPDRSALTLEELERHKRNLREHDRRDAERRLVELKGPRRYAGGRPS
jgi:HK97 family phage prohead protease